LLVDRRAEGAYYRFWHFFAAHLPFLPIVDSMSRWIRLTRRIHLVIALAIGFHFALIATTGALFLFEGELKAWSQARRGWTATKGDVGPERCAAAIADAYPAWDGAWLQFPTKETPFYSAFVEDGSDAFWTDVFVDPGTGRLVGSVSNLSWSVEGVLQVAIQLHIRLCAGETGRRVVDWSVTLLLVELLTGLFLWWPGRQRLRAAFRVRWQASRFLLLYDSHRLSGVLAAPWLLIMVLTGLLWAFPSVMVPLAYWCCGERPPKEFRNHESQDASAEERLSEEATPISLQTIVERVRMREPDVLIRSIHRPAADSRYLTVQATRRDEPETTLSFRCDRGDATIAEMKAEHPGERSIATRLTNEWAHSLHYGNFGGLPTKLLYLAACLAVDGLYMTGITMWLLKRRKRKRSC
jgi:uncharacterized iron-regulated membrane protein